MLYNALDKYQTIFQDLQELLTFSYKNRVSTMTKMQNLIT